MSLHDEHIEKLIARKLDGALSEDESLELDRLLIRSPDARRLYEDYERQDAAAANALAELFPADEVTPVAVSSLARHPHARGRRRTWWGLSAAAAAACLAIVLVLGSQRESGTELAGDPGMIGNAGAEAPTPPSSVQEPLTRVRPAGHTQGLIERHIGRDWYGVRGSDGNIYWLQIDRTRTYRRPSTASRIRLASGDL